MRRGVSYLPEREKKRALPLCLFQLFMSDTDMLLHIHFLESSI